MVGGLTGPRFSSRSIGLLVRLAGRAVYAHAPMFVLRGPLAAASVDRAGAARSTRGGPPGDIAALTGCLDRVRVVMLAHERDGLGARDAVEDGQAGQGGAGASVPTRAGDLDPFGHGALPGLGQRGEHVGCIGRQPEVRPLEPARLPGHGGRPPSEQVDAEGRDGTVRQRTAERATPHQPARGQAQDTWRRTVPRFAHSRMVRTWSGRGVTASRPLPVMIRSEVVDGSVASWSNYATAEQPSASAGAWRGSVGEVTVLAAILAT